MNNEALRFLLVGLLAFGLMFIANGLLTRSTARRRLEKWRTFRASDDAQVLPSGSVENSNEISSRAAAAMAWLFSKISTVRQADLRATRLLLRRSGYSQPDAARVFAGARLAFQLLLFVVGANAGFFLGMRPVEIAVLLLGLFIVGRYLPTWWLERRRRAREREIAFVLPEVIDLLGVCIGGGLGVMESISKIRSEVGTLSRAFGSELELVTLEYSAGKSSASCLRDMSERCDVTDFRSLITLLLQTERFGSSVMENLASLAANIRTTQLRKIEEWAGTAPIRMLPPTVLIFLGTIISALGPTTTRISGALLGAAE